LRALEISVAAESSYLQSKVFRTDGGEPAPSSERRNP
jgi:hypothetical protein